MAFPLLANALPNCPGKGTRPLYAITAYLVGPSKLEKVWLGQLRTWSSSLARPLHHRSVTGKNVASRTCNRLAFALTEPLTALPGLVTERMAQRFTRQPLLYLDEVPQV